MSHLPNPLGVGIALCLAASSTVGCRGPMTGPRTESPPRTAGAARPDKGDAMTVASASDPTASRVYTAFFPGGAPEGAVLALDKEASAVEAIKGVPFDYRIKVTNVTQSVLENVRVTESLDPAYKLASSVPAGNRSASTITFDLGSLVAGEAKTITLTGTATKLGTMQNCSSVSYDLTACWSLEVTQPALSVAAMLVPGEVLACDDIAGKIVVNNPGTGTARGVKVVDKLPAGLMTTDGKNQIVHGFGDLEPGQTKEHTFTLKAAKAGTYRNEAEGTASGGLTAKSAPVSIKVVQPVLAVTAAAPAGSQQLGRRADFAFVVENTGDAPAVSTNVTVTMSAGVEFVASDTGAIAAGDKVAFNVGTLAAGEAKTLKVNYRLLRPGPVTAQVHASCHCAVDALASCSTDVVGVADIGSSLSDDEGVTPVGTSQVYRCSVENQGQVDLTDVQVAATWPTELAFVAHGAGAQAAPAGNAIIWKLGTLRPKQKIEWTLTLKSTKAGEYVLRTTTAAKEIKNKMTLEEITTFVD